MARKAKEAKLVVDRSKKIYLAKVMQSDGPHYMTCESYENCIARRNGKKEQRKDFDSDDERYCVYYAQYKICTIYGIIFIPEKRIDIINEIQKTENYLKQSYSFYMDQKKYFEKKLFDLYQELGEEIKTIE